MKTHLHLILVICLVTIAGTSPSFALSYRLTDLGVLPCYNYPNEINATGQAVGRTEFGSTGSSHAYLYTPGSGIADLGALEGHNYSTAYGINDLGQVVGDSGIEAEGCHHAFLYTPGEGMSDLGVADGSTWSTAVAINNVGQIVGYSTYLVGSTYETRAFLYTAEIGFYDLGIQVTNSMGINDLGQIVGSYKPNSQDTYAYIYTPGIGILDIGSIMGSNRTRASAINNMGQIVGYDWTPGNSHGFLYTSESNIVDLGQSFFPIGVNDAGQVVGYHSSSQETHAFVYLPGSGNIELSGLGGTSSRAYRIDENGRIVGYSTDESGNNHIVAWEPVPEPSSLLALLGGLSGICGIAWRRR